MGFIDTSIAKTTIDSSEVYICVYVHDSMIVNVLFFQKTAEGFQELVAQEVKPEYAKELVRRVRENEVDKVTPEEAKLFNNSLNRYNFLFTEEIKKVLNKTSEIQVNYVGSIAGLNYLVADSKITELNQLYMLQRSKEGYSAGHIPPQFIEMTILDYVHHLKASEKPTFFMLDEKEYIAVKKSKHSQYVYVVNIKVAPEQVSASKAYVIFKENQSEYSLLTIEKSNEVIMAKLKNEAETMVNDLIEKMNMVAQ